MPLDREIGLGLPKDPDGTCKKCSMDNNKKTGTMAKCCHSRDQRNKQFGSHASASHKNMRQIRKESATPTRPRSENTLISKESLQTKDLKEGGCSFLEELTIFEEQRKEEERKGAEEEYFKQQENRERWRNLHYITLNQCLSKPWVSSYFRNIPLRIYCLPYSNKPQMKTKKKR